MPGSKDIDELENELRFEIEGGIGLPNVIEMERYLLLNKEALKISAVSREMQLKPTFDDSTDILNIQLVKRLEGLKLSYQPVPKPKKDQQDAIDSRFIMDFTGMGVKNYELAKETLELLVEMIIQAALKNHPKNSGLTIDIKTGNKNVDKMAKGILLNKLDKYKDNFIKEGITVSVKSGKENIVVVSPHQELIGKEAPREHSRFIPRVPRGAPDLLPPKKS